MKQTFEEYLADIHAAQADGVLDDDMPDDLENFITNLDVAEVMEYAEVWGEEQFQAGLVSPKVEEDNTPEKDD